MTLCPRNFVRTAGVGVAVVNIDDTVAIDVFFRIANAVVVEVPASLAVGARRTWSAGCTVCAISTVGAIVAVTTCKSNSQ
jgi:hypothetical protein